jgi:hypothetical protein
MTSFRKMSSLSDFCNIVHGPHFSFSPGILNNKQQGMHTLAPRLQLSGYEIADSGRRTGYARQYAAVAAAGEVYR